MKRILALVLVLVWGLTGLGWAADGVTYGGPPPIPPKVSGYVPGKIVVKFTPAVLGAMDRAGLPHGRLGIPPLDQLGEQHGVFAIEAQFPGVVKKIYHGQVLDLSGWHIVRFTGKAEGPEVAAAYKALPGVLDAQPVSYHSVYALPYKWPNDQFFSPEFNNQGIEQWHLKKIMAPQAWALWTGSPNTVVAVPDTGVKYYHKDLGGAAASVQNSGPSGVSGNIWENPAPGDDWVGWDFVNLPKNADGTPQLPAPYYSIDGEDYFTPDNDPRDFHGHGTHCAGNVAAITNNSEACASVAGGWGTGSLTPDANGVRVMCLRIGYAAALFGLPIRPDFVVGFIETDYAAQALRYAADHGAKIATCSWGSAADGGLPEAIDYFLAKDAQGNPTRLIFKAAGNDGTDPGANLASYDYICSRADIIKVAATDQNDLKPSWSNYGAWVDICAPGVNIWSLWDDPINYPESEDLVYYLDGTSMASPIAAGVAALIWSQNPGWTATQVRDRLLSSADKIDALNPSYAEKLGSGRVNAYQAVAGAPPVLTEIAADQMVLGKYVKRVWTPTTSYARGDTVVVRSHVKDASGANVPGAVVTVNISGPGSGGGVVKTLSSTTGSDGWAEAKWATSKLRTKPGTYTATVTMVAPPSGYVWNLSAPSAQTFIIK